MIDSATTERILDLARWAPSGDNTQPWRFQILDSENIIIHGFDTRDHCVYDIDGHPSQIAIGALLETLVIAASGFGVRAAIASLPSPDTKPLYQVALKSDAQVTRSELFDVITKRVVQRRPLSTQALSPIEKSSLEQAVQPNFSIVWREQAAQRFEVAKLLFHSAKIRLTTPEAFEVHRKVIEWGCQFSKDRIPDQAVGVDAMTAKLMSWAMQDWRRVRFLNRYLAGTLAPRVQLDLIPGMACAAHFLIQASMPLNTVEHFVEAGRSVQRFWLTATKLGMFVQPEMTPLIFSWYANEGRRFSQVDSAVQRADEVLNGMASIFGTQGVSCGAFFGRIGRGVAPHARSTRLSLKELMIP